MDESKYFKMRDALDDFNYSFGAKEKTGAALKILGKSIFNVGMFTVTEIIPRIPGAIAQRVLDHPNATDEQKEKARRTLEKYK
ncbi:hypothetical protein TI05_03955 [Achromatium sp. WMS3]|nr:hypothetical protein TI05_03955 [Achromatium sp. WMS3]